jgi:hypothetical protein
VCLHHGAFEVKRKVDEHTGCDLFCPDKSIVYAVEDGQIIKIRPFTGKEVGCEWWEDTKAIDIEGYTGTICYGEIEPLKKEGDYVKAGDIIGTVKTVLKKYKGKPMSMLHFAIHSRAFGLMMKHNENKENEPIYDLHIDPTLLLLQLKNKADIMELNGRIDVLDVNEKIDRIQDRLYRLEPDTNWRT